MSKHEIDDLIGTAYNDAIENVIAVINRKAGREVFFSPRDKFAIEDIAQALGVRFDENGEIV